MPSVSGPSRTSLPRRRSRRGCSSASAPIPTRARPLDRRLERCLRAAADAWPPTRSLRKAGGANAAREGRAGSSPRSPRRSRGRSNTGPISPRLRSTCSRSAAAIACSPIKAALALGRDTLAPRPGEAVRCAARRDAFSARRSLLLRGPPRIRPSRPGVPQPASGFDAHVAPRARSTSCRRSRAQQDACCCPSPSRGGGRRDGFPAPPGRSARQGTTVAATSRSISTLNAASGGKSGRKWPHDESARSFEAASFCRKRSSSSLTRRPGGKRWSRCFRCAHAGSGAFEGLTVEGESVARRNAARSTIEPARAASAGWTASVENAHPGLAAAGPSCPAAALPPRSPSVKRPLLLPAAFERFSVNRDHRATCRPGSACAERAGADLTSQRTPFGTYRWEAPRRDAGQAVIVSEELVHCRRSGSRRPTIQPSLVNFTREIDQVQGRDLSCCRRHAGWPVRLVSKLR